MQVGTCPNVLEYTSLPDSLQLFQELNCCTMHTLYTERVNLTCISMLYRGNEISVLIENY